MSLLTHVLAQPATLSNVGTVEPPNNDVEVQPSEPDAPQTNDNSAQLSSIYSRLTALHDRMEASIDPKRQG